MCLFSTSYTSTTTLNYIPLELTLYSSNFNITGTVHNTIDHIYDQPHLNPPLITPPLP